MNGILKGIHRISNEINRIHKDINGILKALEEINGFFKESRISKETNGI